MKKAIAMTLVCGMLVTGLTGCFHKHTWQYYGLTQDKDFPVYCTGCDEERYAEFSEYNELELFQNTSTDNDNVKFDFDYSNTSAVLEIHCSVDEEAYDAAFNFNSIQEDVDEYTTQMLNSVDSQYYYIAYPYIAEFINAEISTLETIEETYISNVLDAIAEGVLEYFGSNADIEVCLFVNDTLGATYKDQELTYSCFDYLINYLEEEYKQYNDNEYTSDYTSKGNYDPDDEYYSSHDSDGDGYITDEEAADAFHDYVNDKLKESGY